MALLGTVPLNREVPFLASMPKKRPAESQQGRFVRSSLCSGKAAATTTVSWDVGLRRDRERESLFLPSLLHLLAGPGPGWDWDWFQMVLSDRSQQVLLGDRASCPQPGCSCFWPSCLCHTVGVCFGQAGSEPWPWPLLPPTPTPGCVKLVLCNQPGSKDPRGASQGAGCRMQLAPPLSLPSLLLAWKTDNLFWIQKARKIFHF